MKISFVATHVWPAIGGTEIFLHHLSRELASEHEVHVLSLSAENEPSSRLRDSLLPPPTFEPFMDGDARVEQLRIPLNRRASLAPLVGQVVPGLRRFAWSPTLRHPYARLYAHAVAPVIADRCRGADIVHHWGSGLLGFATAAAARSLAVPCAITPFMHAGQWGDDPTTVAGYGRYDRVFALLEAEASQYRELGVDRLEVAGVCSPPVEAGGGATLRRARGIEGPLVLFLGQRRSYKGYDLLAAAAERVPGATFAFVGPGDPVTGANIVDAGLVDDDERAAWLDAADLLCLPSEAEILPVSILEAWSVRTPFLATGLPPLQELADLGGGFTTTRTVDAFANRLRALLSQPDALRAAGDVGFAAWEERYTPTAVARAYASVYAELAGAEVAWAT